MISNILPRPRGGAVFCQNADFFCTKLADMLDFCPET